MSGDVSGVTGCLWQYQTLRHFGVMQVLLLSASTEEIAAGAAFFHVLVLHRLDTFIASRSKQNCPALNSRCQQAVTSVDENVQPATPAHLSLR
jgi:hypothetical protein